jgi:hypothetical protein
MSWSTDNISLAKRILVLGALVGMLVLAIMVQPASAAPCHEIYKEYYEEPELINWCGYLYNTCSHIYREGCQTSWYTTELGPCCGGCVPGGWCSECC